MLKTKIKNLAMAAAAIATLIFATTISPAANADTVSEDGLSVSPMQHKIVLSPGDTYTGSVRVYNHSSTSPLKYRVFADSFFVNEKYDVTLGTANDYNAMKEWIDFASTTGTIPAGGQEEVSFTIDVPATAPAGGQYATVVIASVPEEKPTEGAVGVTEIYQLASTIYASISGSATYAGSIKDNSVPSISFVSPLVASFNAENTGNVHEDVKSYLQVFPMFSDEEVYTNEEEPKVSTVLPGTTRYVTNEWEGAPALGLFRVIQTVEAFGATSTAEKIVLICPLWFIVVVLALLALCIFWLVSRAIRRKKTD